MWCDVDQAWSHPAGRAGAFFSSSSASVLVSASDFSLTGAGFFSWLIDSAMFDLRGPFAGTVFAPLLGVRLGLASVSRSR